MPAPVLLGIEADDRPPWDLRLAVDDGTVDAGVPVDGHVRHQDGVLHVAVGVHAHPRAEDRPLDVRSGKDAAGGHDRLGGAAAPAVLREDELRGGELGLVGARGPVGVVEVEDGIHLDEVHGGVEVGVDRPHVAPVFRLLLVLVPEDVGVDALSPRDQAGNDVLAEVVARVLLRVTLELAHQEIEIEDVDAHGAEAGAGVPGSGGGGFGLLLEAGDAALLVDLEHAETARLGQGHLDGGEGEAGRAGDVHVEHLAVVHLVDVVARQHDHEARLLPLDRVEVLVDRVRRAQVPVLPHPLLGRQHLHELPELAAEAAPSRAHVPVQALGLVLGGDEDLPQARVDAVAEGEVDDPVGAPEEHRGLGAVAGQGIETLPRPPREQHRHHFAQQEDIHARPAPARLSAGLTPTFQGSRPSAVHSPHRDERYEGHEQVPMPP